MPRSVKLTIRKHRPWRFAVRSWTAGGVPCDLADYDWRLVANTTPALDLAGPIVSDDALFELTAEQSDALRLGPFDYAVKATPTAGGEPLYVFEGSGTVERTTVQ